MARAMGVRGRHISDGEGVAMEDASLPLESPHQELFFHYFSMKTNVFSLFFDENP